MPLLIIWLLLSAALFYAILDSLHNHPEAATKQGSSSGILISVLVAFSAVSIFELWRIWKLRYPQFEVSRLYFRRILINGSSETYLWSDLLDFEYEKQHSPTLKFRGSHSISIGYGPFQPLSDAEAEQLIMFLSSLFDVDAYIPRSRRIKTIGGYVIMAVVYGPLVASYYVAIWLRQQGWKPANPDSPMHALYAWAIFSIVIAIAFHYLLLRRRRALLQSFAYGKLNGTASEPAHQDR